METNTLGFRGGWSNRLQSKASVNTKIWSAVPFCRPLLFVQKKKNSFMSLESPLTRRRRCLHPRWTVHTAISGLPLLDPVTNRRIWAPAATLALSLLGSNHMPLDLDARRYRRINCPADTGSRDVNWPAPPLIKKMFSMCHFLSLI